MSTTPQDTKTRAKELWKDLADLAEREGGLVETNVVDLFDHAFKKLDSDLREAAKAKPKSYPKTPSVTIHTDDIDMVDWEDIGWTYYGGPHNFWAVGTFEIKKERD